MACFVSASRPHRKTSVLKMDEAALSVFNEIKEEMSLFVHSDHCYQVSTIHVIDIRVRFAYLKSLIFTITILILNASITIHH